MNKRTKNIVYAAIIAALYVVITEFSALFGLSSGVVQIRFSEALNCLCWFTPFAVPGLYIGCIIANLLTGALIWDIIFGSTATLLGAIGVYLLRNKKIASLLCPVVTNAVIVPLVLKYAYGIPGSVWYFVLIVGVGQLISCTVLGYIFGKSIEKRKQWLFK